jgi:hypothetical protein
MASRLGSALVSPAPGAAMPSTFPPFARLAEPADNHVAHFTLIRELEFKKIVHPRNFY